MIQFTKASDEEIAKSLERVVAEEKIKADKETLLSIAKAANGSFRDAAKILEQIVSEGIPVNKTDISQFLFKTQTFSPTSLLEIIFRRDTAKSLEEIERLINKGVSAETILSGLLTKTRSALLALVGVGGEKIEGVSKEDLLNVIELLSQAAVATKDSLIESLPLEIAVVKLGGNIKEKNESEKIIIKEEVRVGNIEVITKESASPVVQIQTHESVTDISVLASSLNDDVWKEILAKTRPVNASIEALLRAAKPLGFDGKNLTLGVYYKFHKERLEEGVNRRILEDVIAGIMGMPVRIICTLTDPPIKKQEPVEPASPVLTEGQDKDIIKVAEEIFGKN